MKWTADQQKAIESRGKDVLVSAAAGSGKTAVLTARILSLLEEGHGLEEFLVITFTNSSAKDMKEKIRRSLLEKSRGPQGEKMARELKKLPRAQISTIHAFCSSILREHFYTLGLDPGFRVASEGELAILAAESLDEVFDEYYGRKDPLFYELLEIFGSGRSDLGLRHIVEEIENFLSQKPRPQDYLKNMEEIYSSRQYWQELYSSSLKEKKEDFLQLFSKTLPLAMGERMISFLQEEKEMLLAYEGFGDIAFARFPQGKAVKEELHKDEIKFNRDKWKDFFREFSKEESQNFEELYEKLQASYVHLSALIQLSLDYREHFYQKRREENKLRFSDLERLSLEAMEKEEIAKQYREKFSFVLVDEYQDTNELQEYLLSLFVSPGSLFMVGDIKQSIYGFREAKPELFLEKYYRFEHEEGKERIDLSKNFRSAGPVLDAVNHLFERVMRKEFGGIQYDDAARLVFGNESLLPIKDEVELLITRGSGDAHEEELLSIIERIHRLVEEGASYRDIVVLYRSPRSFIESAVNLFREAGIPLFSDQGEAYLESLEVKILLNYLEIINNGFLDLPLLSLLRLPRYGFTDKDLYEIRKGSAFFHQDFYAYDTPGEVLEKKDRFVQEIQDLRWKSRQLGISALLQHIYMVTDYEEFLLLMSAGEQRLMNVRLLFERAQEYEDTTQVGLSSFLQYLGGLQDQKQDYEAAKLLGEEANVVRLMSIHRSKGLQFPIVIVAGLWKQYNEMSFRGPLFLQGDVFTLDFYDLEKRQRTNSIFKKWMMEKIKIKEREEEVRLLYVAMTRAQHKLILSTYLKEEEELILGGELPTRRLQQIKSFHHLLFEALETLEPPAPKYVMIEAVEKEEKNTQLPRGVEVEPFIPRPWRREAYKRSVTDLASETPVDIERGFGMGEEGAKRGSLFHKAMELLDFAAAKEDLEKEFSRLEEAGLLRDFQDGALVDEFIHSPLGQRLLKSPRVLREQPFILKTEEGDLVQGIMDLAFWEDAWVLVDYKTDGSLAYVESYRRQLSIYKEALHKLTGQEVKEAYLYFLRLGQCIGEEERKE